MGYISSDVKVSRCSFFLLLQESVSGSDSEYPRFEDVNGGGQKTDKEEQVFDQQEHQSEEIEEILDPIPFELHIERAMGLSASPQR